VNCGICRVILFSFDYPPSDGGISRLCAEVAVGWVNQGGCVRVLCQKTSGDARPAPVPGVPEIRVVASRPWRELRAWWALVRTPRDNPVISGIWYPEGLISLLAGPGRPLVILAHGSELMPARSSWRRGVWKLLLRRVCDAADLVVTNSEYTRALVLRAAPAANVLAVSLGVDHRRFTPEGREQAKERLNVAGKLVVCSVCRLQAYKGHETMLQALAHLPAAVSRRFVYLVAGAGPHAQALKNCAEHLGLSGSVRWLGFVPEEDLPDLYRASDLFALCTRESAKQQEVEGFGLAFLEAQACGTPVVGARTGGIPEAVREGEGGWLIGQDDVDALRSVLLRLANHPDEFREAGLIARRRVERECTWEHYMQRFSDALKAGGIGIG